MELNNIHVKCTGFLNDASYRFHAWDILAGYKDSFGSAKTLKLNLTEILADHAGKFNTKTVDISEDGNSVTINEERFQYKNTKGKMIGKPSPQEVFQTLKFILDRAVHEYAQKFPNDQPSDETAD